MVEPDRVKDWRQNLEGFGVSNALEGLRRQVEGLETLDPEQPKTWEQRAGKFSADLANWAWVAARTGAKDADLARRMIAVAIKVSGTRGSLLGGIVDFALVSFGTLPAINEAIAEGSGWVAQEVNYAGATPPIEVVWSGKVATP
jgi:hypothetical protein